MSQNETTTTDAKPELTAETIAAIKDQVEFYLSDENAARDKFLLSKIKENEEGWVDISVLATFKKLAALTTDVDAIASALSDSTTVIVSEDKTKIRRTNPVPEQSEIDARTVYCKNLPVDVSFETLREEFTKKGPIGAIRMKRNADGEFAGAAFVVFKDKQYAENLLNETEPEVCGQKIECMTIEGYNTKEKPTFKKTQEQKRQEKEEQIKASIEKRKQEIENARENYTRGLVLRFTGLKDVENLTFFALKDYFGHFGEVAHIDYKTGETEGKCRFKTPESCERAVKELDAARADPESQSKFLVAGCIPEVSVLTGEEEHAHWAEICDQRLRPLLNPLALASRGVFLRGRARHMRGRRGFKKGNRDHDDDRKPAEVETVVADD